MSNIYKVYNIMLKTPITELLYSGDPNVVLYDKEVFSSLEEGYLALAGNDALELKFKPFKKVL